MAIFSRQIAWSYRREARDVVSYAHKKSQWAAKPFKRSVKILDRFSGPTSFSTARYHRNYSLPLRFLRTEDFLCNSDFLCKAQRYALDAGTVGWVGTPLPLNTNPLTCLNGEMY